MMITIHGLPPTTKYADLKLLIKQKCNISDFILDSLVVDGADGSKKVRVGLADDSEGSQLIKCLDGYRLSGYFLRLVPVAKSSNIPQSNTYDMRGSYQPRNDYQQPEAPQLTQWGNQSNNWQPTQPHPQPTYSNYQTQQHIAPSYGQNPQKIVPQNTVREVPETSVRPTQGTRYPPQQNYNIPEKPITIMKDNFQGPSQYSPMSGHDAVTANYLPSNQQSGWPSQHQSKPYEKPISPSYEKKLYDDRKYSSTAPVKPVVDLPKSDVFKSYDKSREYSPRRAERGYRRDISPERGIAPSGRQISHSGRISPERSGRHVYVDRRSPGRRASPERRISPPSRHVYPDNRRVSPGRKFSPGRRVSPGHRISPGRRMSPGHRISPGRRVSPGQKAALGHRLSHGRRVSPGHIVSTERRVSPAGRQIQVSERAPSSPHRRISPPRKEEYVRGRNSPLSHSAAERRMRHPSPGRDRDEAQRIPQHVRHESPRRQAMRYSPTRHHADKLMLMEYQDSRPSIKTVRPAYEPPAQASNEAKYTGGYRPNVREDSHYPVRQERWQEKEFGLKDDEDRRDTSRLQTFDIPRVSEQEPKRSMSRNRLSRSPRRDRSPVKDRMRRHSPSPRSPRRSWALEKRHSPDIREPPPPPVWPGQDTKNSDYQQHPSRSNFSGRDHAKISADWQQSQDKKRDELIRQRNADREHYEEEMRRRQITTKWKPVPQMSPKGMSRYVEDDRAHREDKFVRKGFEERRDYREEDDEPSDRKHREPRDDRDDTRHNQDFKMKDDVQRNKEKYAGNKEKFIENKKKEILKKQEQLQKEIDEVYQRAVDFTKKAELYRKTELKKDSSHDTIRRRNEDSSPETTRRRNEDSSDSDGTNGTVRYKEYSRKDNKDYPKDAKQPRHGSIENKDRMSSPAKSKRNTASEQIADKIITKFGNYLPIELRTRVVFEIQRSITKILMKMFGNEDVSFIELVIKFNSKHKMEDEEAIFDAVMSSFPAQFRRPKRLAQDNCEVPAKFSKLVEDPNLNAGGQLSATNQKKLPSRQRQAKKPAVKPPKKRPFNSNRSSVTAAKRQKILQSELTQAPVVEQPVKRVELDERTTQILEEELQAIMMKVWQSLPDTPSLPAERYVAERLRNEASDDIRNVLGLNVTKRLLNVYNPLFLRVQFSGDPDPVHLKQFLKTYNIQEFRQHMQHSNLFVARVSDIADFDRLCVLSNARCGETTVSIKPSYRFSQCPTKLNTVFIKKNKTVSTSKEYHNTADVEGTDGMNSEAPSIDKEAKQATRNFESKQRTNETKIDQPHKTNVEKKYESDKIKTPAQNNVEQSSTHFKADSVTITKLTPNKVPEPKLNAVEKVVKTDVGKDAPQSYVTKPCRSPQAAMKQNTTPANKTNFKQDFVAPKTFIESTPKSTECPTSTTNPKPKPNQVNQDVLATKKVTEPIPKSTEKPVASINIKPKPNQASQEVVVPKKSTVTTPKTNEKPISLVNIKPKPNLRSQEVLTTKKVIQPAPKSTEKLNAAINNKPKPNKSNQKFVASKKQDQTSKPKQVYHEFVAPKKVTEASPKFTISDVDSISSEHFDDTDEMNDEEILALISTGVVVDECSASEEE
ncbi:uncharacterized protein LOC120634780 isoform X3 [Pararge aegeria]|uniref:uncharacterized protein LOC120634780 isoform X3 n=1 Tax=Pararge aegeria TaxID=116150 RepID=UPI0019D24DCD|nr:uncharacterized protein LOC120634780 isoform X3 [Pararge aegeria]